MKFNRTKNVTRTLFFGIIFKIIGILGPFVTRTIIIYKLGHDYVGLTSLFTSVLSLLSISELGIGTAITFCLYKPVAENDTDTIKGLLGLLRGFYRWIGIIILTIGIVLMPFLKYIIKGDYPTAINIYLLYLLYLVNSAVSYLGFAYKDILLNVYQRGDISHKINVVAEISKYVLQIIVLLIWGNYYIYVLILLLSTIAVTIGIGLYSNKLFPEIKPEGNVSTENKKIIKEKILFLSAHSIASKLIVTVDDIVISAAIGLVATGIYGNYNYISSAVLSIILIAYNALTPAIGNSLCSDSLEKNRDIFDSLFFGANWLSGWCALCLLCLYQPFILLWIGEKGLLDFITVIMISLFFYSNASRQITGSYVSAAGMWNKTLVRQIVAAALNLVLDIILVKKYGINGIVFASFFTNAFVALPMDIFVIYKYILKEKPVWGIMKQIIYSTIFIGITAFTYIICDKFKLSGMIELFVRLVICIFVPNILVVAFSFKTKEFKNLVLRFKGLLHRG